MAEADLAEVPEADLAEVGRAEVPWADPVEQALDRAGVESLELEVSVEIPGTAHRGAGLPSLYELAP